MASVDIKSAIMKKQKDKLKKTRVMLDDVNKELIIALTALPVYGKEVRDEEILTLIINGGVQSSYLERMKKRFRAELESGEVKKVKGEYRNKEGFIVLAPRI